MRDCELDAEAAILQRMGGKNNKFNRCHNFCKFFLVLKSETKKKQVQKSKFGLIDLFFDCLRCSPITHRNSVIARLFSVLGTFRMCDSGGIRTHDPRLRRHFPIHSIMG